MEKSFHGSSKEDVHEDGKKMEEHKQTESISEHEVKHTLTCVYTNVDGLNAVKEVS